jgi:hypothetical protein
MKKTIFVSMVIIAMAVMGLATAQDFVSGEMKGSDAPQVFKIGGDDPADDLFVKTMQPVPLSGIDSSVFESAFFMQKDWVFDTTSYSMTPSMGAFAKNNPADGKPLVPAAKSASVGLVSLQKPGEDLT